MPVQVLDYRPEKFDHFTGYVTINLELLPWIRRLVHVNGSDVKHYARIKLSY